MDDARQSCCDCCGVHASQRLSRFTLYLLPAGYAAMLKALTGVLIRNQVSVWRLLPAAAGCVALVYAAAYITRVEKRLPLVYYKRRPQV